MKTISILLVASSVMFSCNNSAEKEPVVEDTVVLATPFNWSATLNDSTGNLEMRKMEDAGPDSLDIPSVIRFLNKVNPETRLELVKQSNDTVYLKIQDATHLTQQMGSTGPQLYFADVVYNMTEIPGIQFVNFDFPEGDHASKGTYSRDNFKGK